MDALLVFVMEKNKNIHGAGDHDSTQFVLLRVQIIGGTFTKVSCCCSHRSHLDHCFFPGVRLKLVEQDLGRVYRGEKYKCELSLYIL